MATSTRRTTKAASPVRNLETAKSGVTINLDTYEVERPSEEFSFVLGGRRIVALDPRDIDWRLLVDIDDPDAFADTVLSDEDGEFFKEFAPFPAGKLNALLTAYRDHFGLGSPGN